MNILSRKKIEDCFDGSAVYVYEVDEPWTKQTVLRFQPLGRFEYFADFPRPLFRLRSTRGLFVNGIEGSHTCRVILPKTNRSEIQQDLEEVLMR